MAAIGPDLIEQIPRGNLRVPRAEFVAVWVAATRLDSESSSGSAGQNWYAGAVAATCQWIACAIYTPPWGRPRPPRAPATGTRQFAFEELIEREYQAAELLPERRPDLVMSQPGWCEGVRATLRWAWRHEGPPPLDIGEGPGEGASGGRHQASSVGAGPS